MTSKLIQGKGILPKLLEKGINILLRKECKNIGNLKIDVFSSSLQIIKGIIHKIHISAIEINYKDLLFDEFELEANEVKIIFKMKNRKLQFKKNLFIKFKISLSEKSLKTTLLSNSWNWIGDMITKEMLNQDKLNDIKIKNDQILINGFKYNNTSLEEKKFDIILKNGKIYLANKENDKSFKIPLEDKVYINNVNIKNNLIVISANSSVSL